MYGSVITSLFSFTFLRLYTFSFSPGGVYDVTGGINFQSISDGGVFVLICSEDQTSSLLTSSDSQTLCRRNISQVCFASAYFSGMSNSSSQNVWKVKQSVTDFTDVNILALSCSDSASTLSLEWHLYNINGELSSGDYPRLELTQWFSYLYGGLAFLMFLHLAVIKVYKVYFVSHFDQIRIIRPLNIAIGLVLLSCSGACIASHAYWQDLSKTGIDNLFGALSIASISTSSLARVSIVFLVLALGKGWQTLREHLQFIDIRQIAILSVFLLLTLSFLATLGGLFSLFLVSLLYLVIMRLQFASMTFSINILTTMSNEGLLNGQDEDNETKNQQQQERLLSHGLDNNLPSSLYGGVFDDQDSNNASIDNSIQHVKIESLVTRQLVLFRALRAVSSIYFLITLFFEVFWDLLGEDYPWIGYCVNQTTMLVFLCYIAWAFRYRNKNESPLFDVSGYKLFDSKWENTESNSETSFLLVSENTRGLGTIAIAEPMRS